MIEARRRFRFLHEAMHALIVRGEFRRQDFQRDGSFESRIVGQVDLAHPTGAELGSNLIVPEICSWGKRVGPPSEKPCSVYDMLHANCKAFYLQE